MAQDDSTVQLPDRGGDRRYAADQYGDEVPDRGFGVGGADAPGSWESAGEATPYQPGAAPSYPPPPEEDRTRLLGGDGWGAVAQPPPVRDRLLVHGVWEVLLIVLVGGLFLFCFITEPRMLSSAGRDQLALNAATLGMLAIALSFSLRAATPNLALGAFAAVAGTLFVRSISHGPLIAAAIAIGVALAAGLVLGLVVAALHVPGWAATLVALCGGLAALTEFNRNGTTVVLDNASVPDPGRHPMVWFAVVAAVSVLFGVLGLIGPIRRGVGGYRPVADPADRQGPGSGVMALLALTVSAGIAGAAGVFGTMHLRTADSGAILPDLLLALGAVLLGGVSAYGRRGGMLGTMLGVLAVTLVTQLGVYRQWPASLGTYAVAGGAILLGLVVTRLVEWGGRDRTLRSEY